MLKITRIELNGDGASWRLEGRLVGPWVDELRGVFESQPRADEPRLRVDLGGVTWVDRDGVALLRNMRERGAVLVNCTGFVQQQLEGA